MDEEPLPLATYATVLAHLLRHRDEPIDKVLAPLGVTLEQLQKADAYFNDRLRESHRLRKGVLAMTFASAFADARKGALFTAEPVSAPILPTSAPAEAQALPSYMTAPAPSSPSPPVSSVALPLVRAPSPLQQTAPPTTSEVPMMQAPPSAMPFRPTATSSSLSPAPAGSAAAAPPGAITTSSGGAPLRLGSSAGPGTGTAVTAPEGPRLPDTPWDQAASRVGKLTLAHYAALTVELSRNPTDLSPLYQRYGLSGPDDLRHVQAAFQAQMQFDAQLRAQFEALVGRMRSMSSKRDA